MRARLALFACVAAFLMGLPRALASDAGASDAGDDGAIGDATSDSAGNDAAPSADAGTAADGAPEAATDGAPDAAADAASDAAEDAPEEASSPAPVTVIACDGALCDTLQGREEFKCTVPEPLGTTDLGTSLAGTVIVLGAGILRRRRRAASCRGPGGGAC